MTTRRDYVQAVMNTIDRISRVGLENKKVPKLRVDLHGADLRHISMIGMNLAHANLRETRLGFATLNEADLSGANLESANLHRAFLQDSNLSRSNLREAILSDTNLSGANLSRADLRDADFTYTEFGAADLSDALIRNANLSGARFRRTAQAHASEPQIPGTHFARLTQSQLDEAVADSFNPPIIDEGVVDYATGKQLVWRGAAVNRSHLLGWHFLQSPASPGG